MLEDALRKIRINLSSYGIKYWGDVTPAEILFNSEKKFSTNLDVNKVIEAAKKSTHELEHKIQLLMKDRDYIGITPSQETKINKDIATYETAIDLQKIKTDLFKLDPQKISREVSALRSQKESLGRKF